MKTILFLLCICLIACTKEYSPSNQTAISIISSTYNNTQLNKECYYITISIAEPKEYDIYVNYSYKYGVMRHVINKTSTSNIAYTNIEAPYKGAKLSGFKLLNVEGDNKQYYLIEY